MTICLQLDHVNYSYGAAKIRVLSDVNADFESGKMYAITGPSGAGKSTLLSLLAGLDAPSDGVVRFEGEDIATTGYSKHRREHVSLVFQDHNLIDYLTPEENLRLVNPKADMKILEDLGLSREEWTTQISNYDNMAAIFDGMKRIDTILIDLCRDFWQYVSMEYFKQKIKAGEVGSSAMPHKVNPIDFENAEGNLGMANAILTHLATKLPISRLQRDLTDSTVLRNVGVPMAHIEIAFKSLTKGLGKLLLNEKALYRDLDNCWAVVAEGIQTILRREGYPKPYEALKALTRTNEGITAESISNFIDTLQVSDAVKAELKAITPHNYTGI